MLKQILIFILFSTNAFSNDTIFTKSLAINERVINIDADGERLLIRLKDKILLLPDSTLIDDGLKRNKQFCWLTDNNKEDSINFYFTDFLPPEKVVDKARFESILPGFATNHMTTARINNDFYICYRGVVLLYRISPSINLQLKGKSVRHVFIDDSIRIISSYNGIFLDPISQDESFSEQPLTGTYYANGETNKIDEKYYINQDGLYVLENDSSLNKVCNELNNSAFRKLLKWKDATVALFNNRISMFDINSCQEAKTLLDDKEFSDMELFGDTLMCSDISGNLYIIRPDFQTDTVKNLGVLFDIYVLNENIILSGESGLYKYEPNGQVKLIKGGIPAIQSVIYDSIIFFTNYEGLYLLRKNEVLPLIRNVEFNKKALSIHNNYLFAGSIDGLYTVQLNAFVSNILPGLIPINLNINYSKNNTWIWIASLIAVLVIIFYLVKRANNHRNADAVIFSKAQAITPESIIELIRGNPELTSVNAIAEKLNTSVVQLNRKLKSFGESPLGILQKVKKEITIEMFKNGQSLEDISRRIGYSKRYIRENFLNHD